MTFSKWHHHQCVYACDLWPVKLNTCNSVNTLNMRLNQRWWYAFVDICIHWFISTGANLQISDGGGGGVGSSFRVMKQNMLSAVLCQLCICLRGCTAVSRPLQISISYHYWSRCPITQSALQLFKLTVHMRDWLRASFIFFTLSLCDEKNCEAAVSLQEMWSIRGRREKIKESMRWKQVWESFCLFVF